MHVLQTQTSLWSQESAEVYPATSRVSEVGTLGDSTSQLREQREMKPLAGGYRARKGAQPGTSTAPGSA